MDGQWKITLAGSALKHQFARQDAILAIRYARYEASPFEQSRVPGMPDPTGWIGPAVDGTEIEVFAEIDQQGREVWIFHMMEARPHIVRKIKAAAERNAR